MVKTKVVLVIAASVVALHAQAQWTNGTAVYVTDTTKNVLVGTTINGANFYLRKANNAVTMGISSGTAGATMFMDKATVASNAAFAYRMLGVNIWNSGMIGSNNYVIRNVVTGINPFIITQTDRVGIGTASPTKQIIGRRKY
ncbi:MAG: hypothetical protein IPP29_08250 [Bacteroidetes bacterium]|nr:hypothetical protein [Bacteroidota bacterium]